MIEFIFQILGQILIIILVILAILLILGIILGLLLVNRNIIIFPRLVLLIVDSLYSPLKRFCRILGLDSTLPDQVGVAVRNKVNLKKWRTIKPKDKLIFLPHCLRAGDCEAKLGKHGVECNFCGKCRIGLIKKEAEPLGYHVYIVPGSSFVEKILKEEKFKAVLGVACYEDLNLMMMKLESFTPQGVLLTHDGCYQTRVDVKEVLDKVNDYI